MLDILSSYHHLIIRWMLLIIDSYPSSSAYLVHGPSDQTVFAGDTVVLECEYDKSTTLAPAWVWMNSLNENKQPTLQTDVYNECTDQLSHFQSNVNVNASTTHRRDMIISDITTSNTGTYFCIDSCGMDDMRQADVTVIAGLPQCKEIQTSQPLVISRIFPGDIIDQIRDMTNYSAKYKCTFEYKGRDDLEGEWVLRDGVVNNICERTSWNSRKLHEVESTIFLNSSFYAMGWQLSYRIRSRKSGYLSQPIKVKQIEPPYDVELSPNIGVYDSNQQITCEAKGKDITYFWIDLQNANVMRNNTLVIGFGKTNASEAFRCIAVNSFGYATQALKFIIQGNGKIKIENGTLSEEAKSNCSFNSNNKNFHILQTIIFSITSSVFVVTLILIKRRIDRMQSPREESTFLDQDTRPSPPLLQNSPDVLDSHISSDET